MHSVCVYALCCALVCVLTQLMMNHLHTCTYIPLDHQSKKAQEIKEEADEEHREEITRIWQSLLHVILEM